MALPGMSQGMKALMLHCIKIFPGRGEVEPVNGYPLNMALRVLVTFGK